MFNFQTCFVNVSLEVRVSIFRLSGRVSVLVQILDSRGGGGLIQGQPDDIEFWASSWSQGWWEVQRQ